MLLIRRPAERMARAGIGTAIVFGASGVIDDKMNQHYARHAAQPSTTHRISPARGLSDLVIAELQKGSDLHQQGVITLEEFAALKARILGI